MIAHVVLGASDPENVTLGQREQMLEVEVGLAEHRDLSGRQPGAQGDHTAAVVVGASFQNNASIMSALRSLFACESPLRLGGVAERIANSFTLW